MRGVEGALFACEALARGEETVGRVIATVAMAMIGCEEMEEDKWREWNCR